MLRLDAQRRTNKQGLNSSPSNTVLSASDSGPWVTSDSWSSQGNLGTASRGQSNSRSHGGRRGRGGRQGTQHNNNSPPTHSAGRGTIASPHPVAWLPWIAPLPGTQWYGPAWPVPPCLYPTAPSWVALAPPAHGRNNAQAGLLGARPNSDMGRGQAYITPSTDAVTPTDLSQDFYGLSLQQPDPAWYMDTGDVAPHS